MCRTRLVLLTMVVMGTAMACSPSPSLAPSTQGMGDVNTGGFHCGKYASWPSYIPADIPVWTGKIDCVVDADAFVRIDFLDCSQVQSYLNQLEKDGFNLQYIVYTAPSIPDDETATRIARGEWDAVDITKGPYHLYYDSCTLRIDGAFFTPDPRTLITPTPIVWPKEIPARIPFPASCVIHSLAQIGTTEYNGGYQIIFKCTDALVQEHYIDALRGIGLVETDRLVSDTGQIVKLTLKDKEIAVEVDAAFEGNFSITVWPVSTSWPIVP